MATMANAYAPYQQPPSRLGAESIMNTMDRQSALNSGSSGMFGNANQGGWGMQGFGQSKMPADIVSYGASNDAGVTGGPWGSQG